MTEIQPFSPSAASNAVAGAVHFKPVQENREEHERGAVQFAQALRPRLFVPMHFGARFLPPEGFLERMEPYSLVHFPGNIGDERELTESCPHAGRL